METRRRQERHRTLKAGKIIFNRKTSVVDCTVRNLSEGGACLQVDTIVGIPETFELLISAEHTARPCAVKWKSAHRLGVLFQ
jgi:PilZ domain